MRRFTFLVFSGLMTVCISFAQTGEEMSSAETDTAPSKPFIFTTESASDYMIYLLGNDKLWRPSGDTMRISLARLTDHFKEPFDSVYSRLSAFDYESVKLKQTIIVKNDTLPLRWLNESTFIVDTVALEKDPFVIKKTLIAKAIDTTALSFHNKIPEIENLIHSILQVQDTITEIFIDTVFLKSKNIQMHQIVDKRIIPPLIRPDIRKSVRFLPDSGKIIISDTSEVIVANKESPFYIVPDKKMPDSLRYAVETLLSYIYHRDSTLLFINDLEGQKMPFWLTTGNDNFYRYWVKNYQNDSITIWVGNPEKSNITLILEEDVNVFRIGKKMADDIPITTLRPLRYLAKLEPLKTIPEYWDYGFSSSFTLNQTHLSNWSKGGESSLSSMFDINSKAEYANTEANMQWTNSGRLKYGALITEEQGLRKTTDMLEFNSQYNKGLIEKMDFSAVFYMKNQIAKGYKYPNDSVVVSKFLNPATFTIGMGVEYKPDKNNRFNFSMLSYKNTFVLDTAGIDQTKHGITRDKRAKQEMGGQMVVKNNTSILDGLSISNTIRLFSNYFDKPQNIDVDWEIDLSKRINWYFTIRLNLHMIYDDDIRFPVLNENKEPVILPDGSKKEVPKLQFKELLGLTLSFKI